VHDAIHHWQRMLQSYAFKNDKNESVEVFKVIDLENGELEKAAALAKQEQRQAQQTTNLRSLIWLETPKNPNCVLQDIRYYSELAEVIGGVVVVDSTFATPVLQRPLQFGAHFVVHSCSKFLAGHSDVIAGAIITKSEESQKILREERSVTGMALGNMESWLLLRSLRTLSVRVNHQSKSAGRLAEWLEREMKRENSHITRVWHPSLKSAGKHYEICQKQMEGKGPGILSVELDTVENTFKFQKALRLFTDATSLGGYDSLTDYRYRWDKTCSPTLLRISIGLEAVEDLIADMIRALKSLDS